MNRLPIKAKQRFGRLITIRYIAGEGKRKSYWLCTCDCGETSKVSSSRLYMGHTKSCGCLGQENLKRRHAEMVTHGGSELRAYSSWFGMKARCLNPLSNQYADYGGRGIKICDRWLEFENFLADMGERPVGMSIGRIDNNGNYELGNCRWETSEDQCKNTRRSLFLTYKNETRILSDWAKYLNIKSATLQARIARGWSVERAFTESVYGKSLKDECLNGHPFSGDNLYVNPKGRRHCRHCDNVSKKKYKAKVKEARA